MKFKYYHLWVIAILSVISSCSSIPICSDYQSYTACDGFAYSAEFGGKVVTRHQGIDYRSRASTPVYSSTYGNVVHKGYSECGGIVLIESDLSTKEPLIAHYEHIDPLKDLNLFSEIKPGDLIGHIQNFNKINNLDCTGPIEHVHFALHYGKWSESRHVNPHDYSIDNNRLSCLTEEASPQKGHAYSPFICKK